MTAYLIVRDVHHGLVQMSDQLEARATGIGSTTVVVGVVVGAGAVHRIGGARWVTALPFSNSS